ncbi:MAG: arginine repressor, partial [Acutalibacteraceae bacterium]
MKTRRHAKIMEIIQAHPVDTQEGLLTYLRQDGFDVTQATVSRDIKELRLVKALGPDGGYRYTAPK